ncbi:MAG: DUF805 domain-containing protein [bacterium]|nr:DUF805 domain-containing protein [bacterium]
MTMLFSFTGRLGRAPYILIALIGVLVKHIVDLSVASGIFHREWTPLNYISPLGIPIGSISQADRSFLLVMVALSIPFAWIGLAITVKRFRTIGWSPWLVLLFFVPIANIVSFALAAVWPDSGEEMRDEPKTWLQRVTPSDPLGAAVVALVVTSVMSVLCVALATKILATYGWGLFAAIPFAQGALAAFLIGVHGRKTLSQCITVAILSLAVTFAALLAVALEGAICIVMAAPLALVFGVLGAFLGYTLQNSRPRAPVSLASVLILILVAPAIMGAEAELPREAPVYRVQSTIVVDAPPSVVWNNVIAFPDLPPPKQLMFRLGIAYPERAHIVGRGVGAVRYCEFSTGNFVEPITTWDPGHRLAFRVAHNAEPLRELSPYPGLDTAHLHNYLVSKHGEFVLVALPGGKTRLTGTTWYQHHLWPAPYWALFSDEIIHQIHLRVLDHIKVLSERGNVRKG